MTDFNPSAIVGPALGAEVLASGLWNPTDSFTPCASHRLTST
jgi:hypothetical protein